MLERKIYPSLDIMKFIMAMLILTQHTCNEWHILLDLYTPSLD